MFGWNKIKKKTGKFHVLYDNYQKKSQKRPKVQ